MVVIRNSAGCVCEPMQHPHASLAVGAAGGAAGGAAIGMSAEAITTAMAMQHATQRR
jgi:hypothetical protein